MNIWTWLLAIDYKIRLRSKQPAGWSKEGKNWKIIIVTNFLWTTLEEALIPYVNLSVSLFHSLFKFLIRAGPLNHYLLRLNHIYLHSSYL